MAVPSRITDYLQAKGVSFETLEHAESPSSVEEARALGIDAGEVAKVIVAHSEGGRALFVLPASNRVDMRAVRQALEDRHARFATEDEMRAALPAFDLGACPPCGELAGARVFLDNHVLERDSVAFAAGTHTDSVRMSVSDLRDLGPYIPVEVCRRD